MRRLHTADRAKRIKTKPSVNEDATDKLMRDLKRENQRLKTLLATDAVAKSNGRLPGGAAEEKRRRSEDEVRSQLAENTREILELEKWFEERSRSRRSLVGAAPAASEAAPDVVERRPHLYNINQDPMLNAQLVHVLPVGVATIGRRPPQPNGIRMAGPGSAICSFFFLSKMSSRRHR